MLSLPEAERETMLKELEDQKKAIEHQQEQRRELQHKIQQMESKLITGGKDIVVHTSEQEEILREKRWVDSPHPLTFQQYREGILDG